uniref:Uncharacterized protein n=1 Tax=Glossina pallidipes TaxID=7398 RepID=A0A1B0A9M3_GLOPL
MEQFIYFIKILLFAFNTLSSLLFTSFLLSRNYGCVYGFEELHFFFFQLAPQGMCKHGIWVQKVDKLMLSKRKNLEKQQREYVPTSTLTIHSLHVKPGKRRQEDMAKLPQNLTKTRKKPLQHKDVYRFETSCTDDILLLRNGWSIENTNKFPMISFCVGVSLPVKSVWQGIEASVQTKGELSLASASTCSRNE